MNTRERKPFSVGDRVAVYGFVHVIGEDVPRDIGRATGEIVKATSDNDLLRIRCDGGNVPILANKVQCRRLKKREEKRGERVEKRHEWWAIKYENAGASEIGVSYRYPSFEDAEASRKATYGGRHSVVHMVELRPGEIPVDRKALAMAWNKNAATMNDSSSNSFNVFCTSLGLPEGKEAK